MHRNYGWVDQTLRVDLSAGEIGREELDPALAKKYLGGRGVNGRLLYDMVRGDVDEFGPENPLIFGVGPLGGTLAPASSRWSVTTKAPQTNIFGDASAGGQFGPELKQAGYNNIIFTGQSARPVYLLIDNGHAELLPADDLWGEDIWPTQTALRKRHGDDIQVATIGRAGENMVRYAGILHGLKRAAGRCGVGAVMGSKKLKAIAVRGTKGIDLADPKSFMKLCLDVLGEIEANPFYKTRSTYGTLLNHEMAQEIGGLSTRNYQSAVDDYDNVNAIGGFQLTRKYSRGMRSCFACPVHCTHYYRLEEGPYKGTYGEGPEYSVTSMLGNRCGLADAEALLKMNELLNTYGMDPITMGTVIGWAMDCYERGIINSAEADGLELTWGNKDAMFELIHKTARREGFGAVLAEGEKGAPRLVGRGSEKLMHHIKGAGTPIQDARASKGFGLGYLTSTRAGDHLRGYFVIEQSGMTEVGQTLFGEIEAADQHSPRGKGTGVRWFEDFMAVLDSFGLCKFDYAAMMDYLTVSDKLAALATACTGWEVDGKELWEAGARVYNVEKAFNARLGLDRKDDNFSNPEMFVDQPLHDGGGKGVRFELDQMLDDYYDARGWGRDGLQTRESLELLGLHDIADELEGMGRLSKSLVATRE